MVDLVQLLYSYMDYEKSRQGTSVSLKRHNALFKETKWGFSTMLIFKWIHKKFKDSKFLSRNIIKINYIRWRNKKNPNKNNGSLISIEI